MRICLDWNRSTSYGDGWGTAATPAPLLFYLHDMLFFQIDFPYRSETRYQQIVYNQCMTWLVLYYL